MSSLLEGSKTYFTNNATTGNRGKKPPPQRRVGAQTPRWQQIRRLAVSGNFIPHGCYSFLGPGEPPRCTQANRGIKTKNMIF
jgi:hypothetical protein